MNSNRNTTSRETHEPFPPLGVPNSRHRLMTRSSIQPSQLSVQSQGVSD